MKLHIFLLFFLGAALCACNQGSVDTVASNTVQSSQVYQIYDIEANKSETKIVAVFRVGGATGTTLELTAPGKILYHGDALAKSDPANLIGTNYRMKGTDYRATLNKYQSAHEFTFTDNDGKIYKNSLDLIPLEVSATGVFALEKSQPTTIPLSRAIGQDETATIAIDSIIDDQIPAADNSVYLNPQRNAVVITPKYWETKQLKSKVPLQIKVKKSANIAQGTNVGGTINASFAAAPVYISVNSPKTTAANAKANADPNQNAKTASSSETSAADK